MMKGGIAGLMKQAQQMQENMKKMQDALAEIEVEGQSGAGMVKVQMTCKHDVRRVTIDPSVMDDKEMLEDLLAAAVNDAVRRVEATTQEKMAGFTSGLNLPPGMKLPFDPRLSRGALREPSRSRSCKASPWAPMSPSSLDELIESLRCLPGVGPKSAQRMAYHLLQRNQKGAARLAGAFSCARGAATLQSLQYLQRGGDLPALRQSAPRREPPCAWSKCRPIWR